ncbi:MAG TPA: LCP family protein [Actinomycetota bacterium]|nr:LCP family protein [Actinomycetota bacterium]
MIAGLSGGGRLRRALIAAAVAASMLAGLVWWTLAPVLGRADAAEEAVGIHKVAGTHWRPERGEPLFVAVLGSDTRQGPPGGGGRCDAIHIVAINPQQRAGTILNFPRDSNIGGFTKVNAACTGGPDRMIQALRSHTGIPIHYYATTEFSHFQAFINELGGVEVNVPYDMHDSPSGADFRPGRIRMDGRAALAFSRNRKDTPRGDFSRTDNQGLFILASLEKFRAEAADPHRIFDYVKAARRHISADVPVSEFIKLALLARDIDPAAVRNMTIPGSTGSIGGASVVFLAPGDIYQRVRDDGIY